MRALLIMAAAAFALSSCQTTSIDNVITQNLPKACHIAETAHVAFSAVAATGKIKARTVAKVEAAYSGIWVICADPTRVNAADALVRVVAASVIITAALKEAQAVE